MITNLQTNPVDFKISWVRFSGMDLNVDKIPAIYNAGYSDNWSTGAAGGNVCTDMYLNSAHQDSYYRKAYPKNQIPKWRVVKTRTFHLAGVSKELASNETNVLNSCIQYNASRTFSISAYPKMPTGYTLAAEQQDPVKNFYVLIYNISSRVTEAQAPTLGVKLSGHIQATYQDA